MDLIKDGAGMNSIDFSDLGSYTCVWFGYLTLLVLLITVLDVLIINNTIKSHIKSQHHLGIHIFYVVFHFYLITTQVLHGQKLS